MKLIYLQYRLELYDYEWEEWVLLCAEDELPEGGKLKVRLVAEASSDLHSISSASTVPAAADQRLEELSGGGVMIG